MGLKIKVVIIEAQPGLFVALFRGIVEGDDINKEKLPEVSLSRKHGNCHFRVDLMENHDQHAPPWSDADQMKAYIERVFNEIKTKCMEAGIALDDEVQQTKLPNIFKGNPYMN